MCHFKLGKPVHHQNLLWWLLTLSISHKPPVPPRHELASEMESIPSTLPVCRDGREDCSWCLLGCGQPRKPPADSEQTLGAVPGTCISSLWYLNQICAC